MTNRKYTYRTINLHFIQSTYYMFDIQTHVLITGAWGMDFRFLLPPFLYYPPFFQNFHNHSFFKIFIIIRFSSFDNISRRHTSRIIRVFCVHSFSTDTVYMIEGKQLIFIFRAISLTSVGKPPCFLHFIPCLHMPMSYQTLSKILN